MTSKAFANATDANRQQGGRRNLILNSAMQVAQRGTSTSTINTYLVDRFRSWGGGVHTMSRTDDISTYPNSRYALRMQRNSGSTDTTFLGTAQGIESANCFPIIGKTVTLSFKARAGADFSASSNALVSSILYGTGNDENPLAMTGQVALAQNNTLTTSVQEFTQTVSIPSSARQVTVAFSYTPTGTAGTNDWYETTEVQLEVGDTATPFEHRSYGEELALCQRYYQTTFTTKAPQNGTSLINADAYYAPAWMHSSGSGTVGSRIEFAVPMRAVPTIIYYNGTNVSSNSGIWGIYDGSAWQDGSTFMNAHGLSSRGFCPAANGLTGNNTTNYLLLGGYAAEAEL